MTQGLHTRRSIGAASLPTRDHHGTQWRAYRTLPPGPPLEVERPSTTLRLLTWCARLVVGGGR